VDLAEIKLQQMRRKARAKAEAKEGKGNQRMQGLQSYEDMVREHELQRMQEGLKKILMLHTPPELSSICGVLALSVKEKASTSIKVRAAERGGAGSRALRAACYVLYAACCICVHELTSSLLSS